MWPPFEPGYRKLMASGELGQRAARAATMLSECRLCPRDCRADRAGGKTGFCRTARLARVSASFSHHGEERSLSGTKGSGTIFFSGCSLGCVFCQNWETSARADGREVSEEELATDMLELERRGCHNINLVTPGHVVPQILEALVIAAGKGLNLPLVFNTGGYDLPETLRLLDGVVDIYMPDLKFMDASPARRYCRAADYPERAQAAILEMHRQVGPLRFGPDGLARRGLLVRHLVMPGRANESGEAMRWLAREVSPDTYVNIMAQYHPAHEVGTTDAKGRRRHKALDKRPTNEEVEGAFRTARAAGLYRFDVPLY